MYNIIILYLVYYCEKRNIELSPQKYLRTVINFQFQISMIFETYEDIISLKSVFILLYFHYYMNFELQPLPFQQELRIFEFSQLAHKLKAKLVPNFENLSANIQKIVADVIKMLINTNDIETVQRYCRKGGLDDTPLLRAHIWKILLQTLPVQSQKWQNRIKENYQTYSKFLQSESFDSPRFDKNLWNEIRMDTRRTHSQIKFFKSQIKQIRIYPQRPTYHHDILTRILYIWARLNGGVRYVQGMNELLAPLYYLQFQTIRQENQSEVFFMFSSLITQIIDMHIQDMDKAQIGINGHMMALNKHLKAVDYQVWQKLQNQKVIPQFYSFRWLALLLSQQFQLQQTFRLWDVLLSRIGYKRFKNLYSMCITIIVLRKQQIMQSNFSQILQTLQRIRDIKAAQIVQISQKLYQKIVKLDIQKTLKIQEENRQKKMQKSVFVANSKKKNL